MQYREEIKNLIDNVDYYIEKHQLLLEMDFLENIQYSDGIDFNTNYPIYISNYEKLNYLAHLTYALYNNKHKIKSLANDRYYHISSDFISLALCKICTGTKFIKIDKFGDEIFELRIFINTMDMIRETQGKKLPKKHKLDQYKKQINSKDITYEFFKEHYEITKMLNY